MERNTERPSICCRHISRRNAGMSTQLMPVPANRWREKPANGMAIAGMVLGITSIVSCWTGVLALTQLVLAIVFSANGLRAARRGAERKGLAITGLTCGITAAVLYLGIGAASDGLGLFL
jgi:hypothetical protein